MEKTPPIFLWVLANSKSDLISVKASAIEKYPELSDKIRLLSSVDDILILINDVIYIQEKFEYLVQPTKKKIPTIKNGIYNIQDLNNKLDCISKTEEIIFDNNKISTDIIDRKKSSSIDSVIDNMKLMYDLLPKDLELNTSIINDLSSIKNDIIKNENLQNSDVCLIRDNVAYFEDINYVCPIDKPIQEYNPIKQIDPIYNNTTESKYPVDFPTDCFMQIESINNVINVNSVKYSNLIQSIESLRKKSILSKIILEVESNRIRVYNRMISFINSIEENSIFPFLSDDEILAIFDNNIKLLKISQISFQITTNKSNVIKNSLDLLSIDFQADYLNNGRFDILELSLARDSNVNWFSDIINYTYSVSSDNPGFQLIEQYYQFLQTPPSNDETSSWKLDQNLPFDWIANRELNKQILLDNIDTKINSIISTIIKNDMKNIYHDILDINSVLIRLDKSMLSSLNRAVSISTKNIEYSNSVINRFNEIDYFIKNFGEIINDLSSKISNLPCLQSLIKPDIGNPIYKDPFNSKGELDSFYMPNPNMPQFDKLSYWKKFAGVATITGLTPTNWTYGLIIPTPSGPIGIPMPIIWKPIFVIPTPISIYVFFIGQCGIMPAPYLYSFSGLTQASGFMLTLRGASDPLKIMPYQIRSKTQTIISNALQKNIFSENIMKTYVTDLNKESVADQKKFTEFNNNDPNNFIPSSIKPLLIPFKNVIPTFQNIFTKKSFGSKKTGLILNKKYSNKLPKIFLQDDLPSYDRLSIKNIPLLIYTNSFCLIGSYTGGLPVSFPPLPKYTLPIPPVTPPVPDNFI